jgi:type II secretory pathway predicted ATPase ExeA/chromosome segregation ATPase
MYANHFGLRCLPFEDRADAQFFFATPERDETLAAMEYEAHFGHGILVVEAEAGMGKTLLVRTLAGRLDANDHPVVISWQAGGERSLIRECCKGFGVSIPSSGDADRAVSRLRRHLMRSVKAEHRSLLIVDQAENMSSANFQELALLAEIEGTSGKLLPIILVGQPMLSATLENFGDDTLKQHTRGVRKLNAMSATETAAYIAHRLSVAGVTEAGTFASDAMTAIHEAAGGVPRLVNRIAHDALAAAYGAGKRSIDASMIPEATQSTVAGTRSVAASEIGLRGAEQVAGGWGGSSAPTTREVVTSEAVSAHVSAPAIEYSHDPKPPAHAYGVEMETPPAFEDADEFHDRLAQTVSRSERATASTEITLAKVVAVEQHLSSLLGRAEAVIAALGGSVQEGESLADHIKRRLNEIAGETESRVEAMESRAIRAGTVAGDVEDQIQRIELACGRAEAIEQRLSTGAGEFADKADDVQRHVATISEIVTGSDDARRDMEKLIARASMIADATEEKLAVVRESAKSVVDETTSESAKAEACLVSIQTKFATVLEKMDAQTTEATRAAEKKLVAVTASVKSAVEEANRESTKAEERLDSVRSQLAATLEEAGRVERDLGDRMLSQCIETVESGLNMRCEQVIDESRSRVVGVIGKLAERIDAIKVDADAVEARQEKVSDAHRHVGEAIDKSEATVSSMFGQIGKIDERIDTARDQVGKLVETVSTVAGPLEESISHGETLIAKSGTAFGELESTLDRVGSALIQTGRACEQAEVARAKASECERIVTRFDEDTKFGRETADRLAELVPTGKEVAKELSGASAEATRVAMRLGAQHHDAVQTTEQLERGVTQGQKAIDRITAATITAEQAVESVQTTSSNLQGRHESADRLVGELDSLNGSARQLHEALQGVVAHADEKVGRLGSHSAAASKVLKQLGEANIDIHGTLKQAMNTQRKIETLTKDVWSLTSKSENCVKTLTTKAATAERIVEKIDAATSQVQPIVSDLSSHVEKAVEFEQRLASETTKAGDIVERLNSITSVLQQAKEINDSVGKTVDDARAVGTELSAAMEESLPQYQKMQEANASAQGLIETSTQLKSESDAAVERFIENLQVSQQVIEDVETQATSLDRQMQKAKKDGDRIEQHIEALMIQPKKLLEQAQTQSVQLERVCDAVRKVFANLSKTSLEAKGRTEELQAAERQATARLEQLIGETGATTQMLNQWVKEAINAQARLQQTVERIPSIKDTHPTNALQRLSAQGQPVTRVANPSAHPAFRATEPTAAETARLVKAASGSSAAVTPGNKTPEKTSPRAAEIARMIEDAKNAEAVA